MNGSDASQIDTSVAHPARRYNYWLGGKDNFAADRESGDALERAFPGIKRAALENRWFLRRAVTMLAAAGVEQFLDIGTGIPAPDNTHEVAQRITAGARVVYADNDPIVLSHARALLTPLTREGVNAYIEADLSEPATILGAPELQTLDFSKPIALLLAAIVHFLTDDKAARSAVRSLIAALPAGSYVVLSHATPDLLADDVRRRLSAAAAPGGPNGPFRMRTRSQITPLLTGLELVEPGLVPVQLWRPDRPADELPADDQVGMYAAVARKLTATRSPRPGRS